MEGLLLFCVLLGAPFFGLGYYRSWKVAVAVILLVAALAASYWYGLATAAPDDAAAKEWGAQAAPAFFAWMAVIFSVAVVLGFAMRLAVERSQKSSPASDGDIRE